MEGTRGRRNRHDMNPADGGKKEMRVKKLRGRAAVIAKLQAQQALLLQKKAKRSSDEEDEDDEDDDDEDEDDEGSSGDERKKGISSKLTKKQALAQQDKKKTNGAGTPIAGKRKYTFKNREKKDSADNASGQKRKYVKRNQKGEGGEGGEDLEEDKVETEGNEAPVVKPKRRRRRFLSLLLNNLRVLTNFSLFKSKKEMMEDAARNLENPLPGKRGRKPRVRVSFLLLSLLSFGRRMQQWLKRLQRAMTMKKKRRKRTTIRTLDLKAQMKRR